MRLGEYLDQLCWSQADLARAAGVSTSSVKRALSGQKLTRRVAAKILGAIRKETRQNMSLADISDLRVVNYRASRRKARGAAAGPGAMNAI
jgi:transcriptional regulator with XRE-family HTH domain